MGRCFFLSILIAACPVRGEEPKAQLIPLSEVWGYMLPDTKDVRELDPASFGRSDPKLSAEAAKAEFHSSRFQQILRALYELPTESPQREGFAVVGEDKVALEGVFQVLVEGKEPVKVFSEDDRISLVVFSARFGAYLQLRSIEKERNTITLTYRFVSHHTLNLSAHIAIVPLGKLPAGKYAVNVIRDKSEPPPGPATAGVKRESRAPKGPIASFDRVLTVGEEWEDRVPCRSFDFIVKEKE